MKWNMVQRKKWSKNGPKSFAHNSALEKDIRAKVAGIVSGKTASGNFYGNLLDHITACPDRRMEVYLKRLPAKWIYVLK